MSIYLNSILEMNVLLMPTEIGSGNRTRENLRDRVGLYIEGKCISEGYVRPQSVKVLQYSSGMVKSDKIEFTVIFECDTCYPVEGQVLKKCRVRSVTKAGIHAEVQDSYKNIPINIFIIRDHYIQDERFHKIEEDANIDVKVIGSRFELNDPCVEVIASLEE